VQRRIGRACTAGQRCSAGIPDREALFDLLAHLDRVDDISDLLAAGPMRSPCEKNIRTKAFVLLGTSH
jgi:hypothetical protein